MTEDLITDNFSHTVNKKLINRSIRLLLIQIISFTFFTLLNFIDWYFYIRNAAPFEKNLFNNFEFRIYPVIIVIDSALAALSFLSYLKGQKLILDSFEKDNTEFFNKGYSLINESTLLNIAGYIILICGTVCRLFLTHIF